MRQNDLQEQIRQAKHGDRVLLYEGPSCQVKVCRNGDLILVRPISDLGRWTYTAENLRTGEAVTGTGSPNLRFTPDGHIYCREGTVIKRLHGNGTEVDVAKNIDSEWRWGPCNTGIYSVRGRDGGSAIIHNDTELPALLPCPPSGLQWTVRDSGGVFLLKDPFSGRVTAYAQDGERIAALPEEKVEVKSLRDEVFFRGAKRYYRGSKPVLDIQEGAQNRLWAPHRLGILESSPDDQLLYLNGSQIPYEGPFADWSTCDHGVVVELRSDNGRRVGRMQVLLIVLHPDGAPSAPASFDADALVA